MLQKGTFFTVKTNILHSQQISEARLLAYPKREQKIDSKRILPVIGGLFFLYNRHVNTFFSLVRTKLSNTATCKL